MDEALASPFPVTPNCAAASGPRYYWDTEKRITLRVLIEGFEIGWSEALPIYNTYVKSPNGYGVGKGALIAQYNNMRNKSTRLSKEQLRASYPSSSGQEEHIRISLEATARQLGMKIVRRETESNVNLTKDSCTTPSRGVSDRTSIIRHLLESDREVTEPRPKRQCTLKAPKTPTKFAIRDHNSGFITPFNLHKDKSTLFGVYMSPELSPTQAVSKNATQPSPTTMRLSLSTRAGQHDKKLPLIVFRAFTARSQGRNGPDGFCAGLFSNAARIEQCPPLHSELFRSSATKHVGKCLTSSPLISMTDSPLRAMIKVSRLEADKYLAIVDLHKVDKDGSVFNAESLDLKPTKTDKDGRVKSIRYYPAGEWLAWGIIKPQAIISIVAVQDLVRSPPSIPSDPDPFLFRLLPETWQRLYIRIQIRQNGYLMLSYYGGSAVGQLIRLFGLPELYLIDAVTCIVKDWQFKTRKHEKWQENVIFCKGVRLGYEGYPISSLGNDKGEVIDLTGDDLDKNNFLRELQQAANNGMSDDIGTEERNIKKELADITDDVIDDATKTDEALPESENDNSMSNDEIFTRGTQDGHGGDNLVFTDSELPIGMGVVVNMKGIADIDRYNDLCGL
ncbi:MAG: hypothetical protein Q9164_003792 [Protoblastenia rupestris]